MGPELTIILTTLGLYAVAVVSPGPNFALISRLALSGSKQAAIGATFGLGFAATVYAILTMTGLALLLTRIGWLASFVQIAGGCYLVFLGLTAFLPSKGGQDTEQRASGRMSMLRGFRMGVLVNLSNPKVITFFVSLYAVTVPIETDMWAKIVILIGGFLLEILWYGLVIALLSTPPARRAYDRFGRWIERAFGVALMFFGVGLISE